MQRALKIEAVSTLNGRVDLHRYGDVSELHPYPLLLDHGGLQNERGWLPQLIPMLVQQGICCVSFDHLGHGANRADALQQFGIADRVAATEAAYLSLQAEFGGCAVLGHSVGGMTVQMRMNDAAFKPDRVILLNPLGRNFYAPVLGAYLTSPLTMLGITAMGLAQEILHVQWAPRVMFHDLLSRDLALIRGLFLGEVDEDSARAFCDELFDDESFKLFVQVAFLGWWYQGLGAGKRAYPVHVIGSLQDHLVPATEVLRVAQRWQADSTTLFPDRPHMMHLRPDFAVITHLIARQLALKP